MDPKLTPRHRAILVAVVENYIATGEPVGSATIATALGPVSSATIRNAMAELAAMGLLNQPHTSAGRIPTPSAFRFYVEQLNSGSAVPVAARPDIDDSFAGIDTAQSFLERTSHVLALLSSGVGVAITAPGTMGIDTLEHVHFSRLAPARVLAVVVMTSGLVRDRALTLDSDLDIAALESAAAFLNQNFRGFTIQAIRDELARRIETERSDYQKLLASVNQLWHKTMPAEAGPRQTVYIEGVANLLGSEADRRQLHAMMAALEEKQRIVDLLTAYVDTRQESVRVVFDLEEHAPEMRDLVLIAAPARLAGESHGAVGVIGPKRMHYERAMSAVSYISQLFDRMLQPPQ